MPGPSAAFNSRTAATRSPFSSCVFLPGGLDRAGRDVLARGVVSCGAEIMKTCTRCGRANPESSTGCECGGSVIQGDRPDVVEARVAGFWIRIAADLLDALILGGVGFVLATIFRSTLLEIGEKAALLGAPITLLYTGVLQSHLGRGQTLAKRLLGIRVVRLDGSYLSLDRSLVRWAIMGVVVYGSTVAVAASAVLPVLKAPVIAAALGGTQVALLLGCLFLVPFHPLKRGIHDLLTGSIVLRKGSFPAELVSRLNNPRRDRNLALAALLVAAAAAIAGLLADRSVARLQCRVPRGRPRCRRWVSKTPASPIRSSRGRG